MRWWLRISAVLLASLVVSSGCGSDTSRRSANGPAAPARADRIVHGTGYQLTLPDGWKRDAETAERAGLSEPFLTGAVLDGYAVNVTVIMEPVTSGISLESYYQAALRLLTDPAVLERSGLNAKDFGKPGPPRHGALDGQKSISHDLPKREGETQLLERQVVVLRRGSAYTITFYAPRRHFAEQLAQFDAILNSWHWTQPAHDAS